MSQLFDALRRGRQRAAPTQHPDRTARADAVLATLGYRKKQPPSAAKPVALVVAGLVAALAVAWSLWPDTSTRPRPPAAQKPPTPTPTPASAPAAAPGATAAAAPPAAPPRPVDEPPPAPAAALVVTRPPAASVPPAISQMGAPLPADAGSPAALTPPARRAQRSPLPRVNSNPGDLPVATAPAASRVASASTAPVGTVVAPPPSSAELFRLALYHHRAGDFAAAETSYRALLQRNELDAQVHNNLGLLYRDKGAIDDAVKEFQRALLINPEYLTARNNLGVVYMGSSRLDEAAAQFHRVLADDPRNIDASVNLALVEKAAGRTEHAKESLLRALTIDPRNAPAHFNLASLYEQSGDRVRAVEHYRSFLDHAGADHAARAPDARARIDALARAR